MKEGANCLPHDSQMDTLAGDLLNLTLEEISEDLNKILLTITEMLKNSEEKLKSFFEKKPRALTQIHPLTTKEKPFILECIERRIDLLEREIEKNKFSRRFCPELFYHLDVTNILFGQLEHEEYEYLSVLLSTFARLCSVWQKFFSFPDYPQVDEIKNKFIFFEKKCLERAELLSKPPRLSRNELRALDREKSKKKTKSQMKAQVWEAQQEVDKKAFIEENNVIIFILLEAGGYDPENGNNNAAIILDKYNNLLQKNNFFDQFLLLYMEYIKNTDGMLKNIPSNIVFKMNQRNWTPITNIILFTLREILTRENVSKDNYSRMLRVLRRTLVDRFAMTYDKYIEHHEQDKSSNPYSSEIERHKVLLEEIFDLHFRLIKKSFGQKRADLTDKEFNFLKRELWSIYYTHAKIEIEYCHYCLSANHLDNFNKSSAACKARISDILERYDDILNISGYDSEKARVELNVLSSRLYNIYLLQPGSIHSKSETESPSFAKCEKEAPSEKGTPGAITLPSSAKKVFLRLQSSGYWAYGTGYYVLNHFLNFDSENVRGKEFAFNRMKIVTNCLPEKLEEASILAVRHNNRLIIDRDLEIECISLSFEEFSRQCGTITDRFFCDLNGNFIDTQNDVNEKPRVSHSFIPALRIQIDREKMAIDDLLYLSQLVVQLNYVLPDFCIHNMQVHASLLTSVPFDVYIRNINCFFMKGQGLNYFLFLKSFNLFQYLLPPSLAKNYNDHHPVDVVTSFHLFKEKLILLDKQPVIRLSTTVYEIISYLFIPELAYQLKHKNADFNQIMNNIFEEFWKNFPEIEGAKKQRLQIKILNLVTKLYKEDYLPLRKKKETGMEKEEKEQVGNEKETMTISPAILTQFKRISPVEKKSNPSTKSKAKTSVGLGKLG